MNFGIKIPHENVTKIIASPENNAKAIYIYTKNDEQNLKLDIDFILNKNSYQLKKYATFLEAIKDKPYWQHRFLSAIKGRIEWRTIKANKEYYGDIPFDYIVKEVCASVMEKYLKINNDDFSNPEDTYKENIPVFDDKGQMVKNEQNFIDLIENKEIKDDQKTVDNYGTLYSTSEVAKKLNICSDEVLSLCKNNELVAVKNGNYIYVTEDSYNKYISNIKDRSVFNSNKINQFIDENMGFKPEELFKIRNSRLSLTDSLLIVQKMINMTYSSGNQFRNLQINEIANYLNKSRGLISHNVAIINYLKKDIYDLKDLIFNKELDLGVRSVKSLITDLNLFVENNNLSRTEILNLAKTIKNEVIKRKSSINEKNYLEKLFELSKNTKVEDVEENIFKTSNILGISSNDDNKKQVFKKTYIPQEDLNFKEEFNLDKFACLTVSEVSSILRINRETVIKMIENKEINSFEIAGNYRIKVSELERIMSNK